MKQLIGWIMGKIKNTAKKLLRLIKNLKKRMLGEGKKTQDNLNPVQTPKAILIGFDEKKLLDLAIDIWKLEKNIKKVLDIDENRQVKSSLKKLHEYVGSYKIETIDYDGEKYHENLNVKILSSEEKEDVKDPIIVETVKPTILIDGILAYHASVIINTPQNDNSDHKD